MTKIEARQKQNINLGQCEWYHIDRSLTEMSYKRNDGKQNILFDF